ncbi:stalk domain-containing protein [Paenibacillus sp. IHBB 10380]|uniref:stalk domain-containing protein n=1 Tax=Paenibacillus sp. IHBB 10380 TaxID=1566358 RepID=UPI0009E35885|nr:stalk domain-containing protein [Paenibacillus sp. IHBB 10380]
MRNCKVFTVIVAGVLVTSALSVGIAEAASTTKQTSETSGTKAAAKYKVDSTVVSVNGVNVTMKSILVKQVSLYALSDIAQAVGATIKSSKGTITLTDATSTNTIQMDSKSSKYQVNGSSNTFKFAPVMQDGRTYVELPSIVEALGGEWINDAGQENQLLSVKRLTGEFDSLHWDASGHIIAVKQDEEVPQVYKLNKSYHAELLSTSAEVAGMEVSPNGQWGIYTDDKDHLVLLNLSNGQVQTLGEDTSVKTDLMWSSDNSKVYFIQGDKQDKISYIDVNSAKITQVLEDKVENKSEVHLSADGTKLVYIVNITGVAKNDSSSSEDSLTIDYSSAGAQLYSLDLVAKDAKPKALTTSNDNKLYPSLVSGGNVVYLSADPDNSTASNVLKIVTQDGKSQNLVQNLDVTYVNTTYSGTSIVVGLAQDGWMKVFKVSAEGAVQELYSTESNITEASLSPDGSQLGLISDGRLIVVVNEQVLQLTQ